MDHGDPGRLRVLPGPRVNEALKDVLNAWREYLDSPDSLYVLNDSAAG